MADDIAVLGFVVDSRPLLEASAAADKLTASSQRLGTTVQGTSQSHTLASTQTQRLTADMRAAEVMVNRYDTAHTSLRSTFRLLSREASLLSPQLALLLRDTGSLAVGAQRLSLGITGAVVVVAALSAVIFRTSAAFIEFEAEQAKVSAALRITSGAAGQTAASINGITGIIAKLGGSSVTDIRAAELELLKFREVGIAFPLAMKAAADIASVGFVDLKGAATALGKAIAEPRNATDLLRDAGVRISPVMQKQIDDYDKTGKAAQATALILEIIRKQIGGQAAETDTLSTSWQKALNTSKLLAEGVGAQVAEWLHLKDALDWVARKSDDLSGSAQTLITWIARIINQVPGLTLAIKALEAVGAIGNRAPVQLTVNRPSSAGASFNDRFSAVNDNEVAATKAAAEAEKIRKEKIDAVTIALDTEAKAAARNAVDQRAYDEAGKAKVVGLKEFAEVLTRVNLIFATNFMKDATNQFTQQNSALQAEIDTWWMGTAAATAYRKEQELITKAKIEGISLDPAMLANIKAQADAFGKLTTTEETVKALKQAFTQGLTAGANTFVDSLRAGKSLMDSLTLGARALSQSLQNSAITQLLSGNFVAATVAGIAGQPAGLFARTPKKKANDNDNEKEAERDGDQHRQAA